MPPFPECYACPWSSIIMSLSPKVKKKKDQVVFLRNADLASDNNCHNFIHGFNELNPMTPLYLYVLQTDLNL